MTRIGRPGQRTLITILVALLLATVPSAILAQPDDMPIRVHLRTFEIVDADEDGALSNGDEPYLFVVVVLADGTTINADNLTNASVRLLSPAGVHGNLGLNHVGAGRRQHDIPRGTGLFEPTIRPIAGLDGDDARQLSQIAVLVIAMEEDGTSDRAANAARRALLENLQTELDAAVQSLRLPNIGQLKDRIRDKMLQAATDATLRRWWSPIEFLAGIADPDDFIDAQVVTFTYAAIARTGPGVTMPIRMDFRKRGVHYRLHGIVQRR